MNKKLLLIPALMLVLAACGTKNNQGGTTRPSDSYTSSEDDDDDDSSGGTTSSGGGSSQTPGDFSGEIRYSVIGSGDPVNEIKEMSGAKKMSVVLSNLPAGKSVADCTFTWPASTTYLAINDGGDGFAKNEKQIVPLNAGSVDLSVTVTCGTAEIHILETLKIARDDTLYTSISTVDDFVEKLMPGSNATITNKYLLTENLDLGGMQTNGPSRNVTFNGVLDGNGHTIQNFNANPNGSGIDGGLFQVVGSGIVRNLHLIGQHNQTNGFGSLLCREIGPSGVVANCLFEVTSNVDTSGFDGTAWTWQRSGAVAGVLAGTVRDSVCVNVNSNPQTLDVAPYCTRQEALIENVYTSQSEANSIPFDPDPNQAWCTTATTRNNHYAMNWGNFVATDSGLDSDVWVLQNGKKPSLIHDGEQPVTLQPKITMSQLPTSMHVDDEELVPVELVNFPDSFSGGITFEGEDVGTKISFTLQSAVTYRVRALAAGTAHFTVKYTFTEGGTGTVTANFTVTIIEAGAPNVLPVIPAGNQQTKVEGAGAWIYLDNTSLGITGSNAATILAASTVTLTVSMTAETPEDVKSAAAPMISGGDNPIVISNKSFDDYGTNTVRLFVTMDKGVPDSWMLQHTFNITLVANATSYVGTVTFIGGAYQAA